MHSYERVEAVFNLSRPEWFPEDGDGCSTNYRQWRLFNPGEAAEKELMRMIKSDELTVENFESGRLAKKFPRYQKLSDCAFGLVIQSPLPRTHAYKWWPLDFNQLGAPAHNRVRNFGRPSLNEAGRYHSFNNYVLNGVEPRDEPSHNPPVLLWRKDVCTLKLPAKKPAPATHGGPSSTPNGARQNAYQRTAAFQATWSDVRPENMEDFVMNNLGQFAALTDRINQERAMPPSSAPTVPGLRGLPEQYRTTAMPTTTTASHGPPHDTTSAVEGNHNILPQPQPQTNPRQTPFYYQARGPPASSSTTATTNYLSPSPSPTSPALSLQSILAFTTYLTHQIDNPALPRQTIVRQIDAWQEPLRVVLREDARARAEMVSGHHALQQRGGRGDWYGRRAEEGRDNQQQQQQRGGFGYEYGRRAEEGNGERAEMVSGHHALQLQQQRGGFGYEYGRRAEEGRDDQQQQQQQRGGFGFGSEYGRRAEELQQQQQQRGGFGFGSEYGRRGAEEQGEQGGKRKREEGEGEDEEEEEEGRYGRGNAHGHEGVWWIGEAANGEN